MKLSAIGKKIVFNRIIDTYGMIEWDAAAQWLENVIVDPDLFPDFNTMYNALVTGYHKTIIY